MIMIKVIILQTTQLYFLILLKINKKLYSKDCFLAFK